MTDHGPRTARLSRTESRQQTRARLIEAAIELFASRGVNSSSLEEISDAAGFSRGAFHSNFADRAELVEAVRATVIGDLAPELSAILESDSPASERLEGYIRTYLTFCYDQPSKAVALAAVVEHDARNGGASYREAAEASLGDLVRMFDDGQGRGEMRSFDTGRMAFLVRSALDTEAARARPPTSAQTRAEVIDDVVATFHQATARRR